MAPGYSIKKAAACSLPPGDEAAEGGSLTSKNRDQHKVSRDNP